MKQKGSLNNYLWATFVAIVLTITLTWPLSANLGSYFTDNGDFPLNASVLWYNSDSLLTGRIFHQADYFNGFQSYPQPYSLAFGNNALFPSLIFTPLYTVTQNLALSTNLLALSTFVLSFMSAFYIFRQLTKNTLASLIGASVYAFNPLILSRFPIHLDLLNRYFLPLVIYFGYRYLINPNWKLMLALSLFFTLNALSVNYYLFFALTVAIVLWLPLFGYQLYKQGGKYLLKITRSCWIGLIFLPILFYFYLPYLNFANLENASRPLGADVFFSARLIDYTASLKSNLIYSSWTNWIDPYRQPRDDQGIFNYEEHTLMLNLIPLALFIAGLIYLKRHKFAPADQTVPPSSHWLQSPKTYYLSILILAFILTLGPYWVGWNGYQGNFKLPFYYLYQLLIFFKGLRVPTRFDFIFYVPFSIIVSFGAVWIFTKARKYQWLLAGLIIILIALENFNFNHFSDSSKILAQTQANLSQLRFLRQKATLHLPIVSVEDGDFGRNSAYLNWATQTGEKVMNINAGYLPPDQLMLLDQIKNELDDNSLRQLKALQINYLIIHKIVTDPKITSLLQKYSSARIIDQPQFVILDLAKIDLPINICNFDIDIQVKPTMALQRDSSQIYNAVQIINTGDCYLPSFYNQKYRDLSLEVNNLPRQAHLRLPILINPKQTLVLTDQDQSLRLDAPMTKRSNEP